MSENKLSKTDSARDVVRAATRALARSQGGDTTINNGVPNKEIGGLYAGGACKDHEQSDLFNFYLW
jgi:hypothetical protein